MSYSPEATIWWAIWNDTELLVQLAVLMKVGAGLMPRASDRVGPRPPYS